MGGTFTKFSHHCWIGTSMRVLLFTFTLLFGEKINNLSAANSGVILRDVVHYTIPLFSAQMATLVTISSIYIFFFWRNINDANYHFDLLLFFEHAKYGDPFPIWPSLVYYCRGSSNSYVSCKGVMESNPLPNNVYSCRPITSSQICEWFLFRCSHWWRHRGWWLHCRMAHFHASVQARKICSHYISHGHRSECLKFNLMYNIF